MKRELFLKNIEHLEWKNNLFLVAIVLLSFTQLFSLYFMSSKKERICILPPDSRGQIWMQGSSVSQDLLKSYAVYFANLLMTKNPSNVAQCREDLLQFCSAEFYPKLRKELIKEEEEIKRGSLSQAFYYNKIQLGNGVALIQGRYISQSGTRKIIDREAKIRLCFYLKNDRMYITSIEEVKVS